MTKINRQAENEQGADSTVVDSKRKQVSKRLFIDDSGKAFDTIEGAAGARYTLLDPTKKEPDNVVADHDYVFGKDPAFDRMCAIFGFHTKIGNVVNTVLNDKDEPGTAQDASEAIKEFVTKASGPDGVWADRTTGGPGQRVDRDALAAAIVHVATAAGKTVELGTIRARLDSEPAFLRGIRQVPEVASEYATRVGKQAKSLNDLL